MPINELLNYVVQGQWPTCDLHHAERLVWYRSSSQIRAVEALQTCVFEKMAHLFGEPLVKKALALYVDQITEFPLYLDELAYGFSDFIRLHSQDDDALIFAASAQLCEEWWRLLHADDPAPCARPAEPSSQPVLGLVRTHRVLKSRCPLLPLWIEQQLPAHLKISAGEQSYVMVKTSPVHVHLFAVPSPCESLLRFLSDGGDLNAYDETEAQECVTPVTQSPLGQPVLRSEGIAPEVLNWVATLSQAMAIRPL